MRRRLFRKSSISVLINIGSIAILFAGNLPINNRMASDRANAIAKIAPAQPSVKPMPNPQPQPAIASLANGRYQYCSELQPKDGRNGAGVCFYFIKVGDIINGYYGYPNTDDLICVRGRVKANMVTGEALTISWLGREWTSISKIPFKWDEEGHLLLKNGEIIRTTVDAGGRMDWVLFRFAGLYLKGFYRYDRPIFSSPSQVCQWK